VILVSHLQAISHYTALILPLQSRTDGDGDHDRGHGRHGGVIRRCCLACLLHSPPPRPPPLLPWPPPRASQVCKYVCICTYVHMLYVP